MKWKPSLLALGITLAATLDARPQTAAAHQPAGKDGDYFTDFDSAKTAAAAAHRPIFALFTGSDWCPWCLRLREEILETAAFKEFAATNLVLFMADFPREKKLPAGLRERNKALAEKYEVAGYPTVLLLDERGEVKGRTGYRRGGPEKYLVELREQLQQDKAPAADSIAAVCGYAAKQRIDYQSAAPGGFEALLSLEKYVRQSGLETSLLQLVKARASQLNGCAYCLDMHTKDALADHENEQRLLLLPVWREAPCYSDRERAALAWTEAVTLISQNEIGDELYAGVRRYFSEKEVVDLTYAIVAINGWNRLAISTRAPVGLYQAKGHP